MITKYMIKLYIAGQNGRSIRAIHHLRHLVTTHLADQAEVEIIDILEDPESAMQERIVATPTLIISVPPPRRHVIGDLSDIEPVLWALGLSGSASEQGDSK